MQKLLLSAAIFSVVSLNSIGQVKQPKHVTPPKHGVVKAASVEKAPAPAVDPPIIVEIMPGDTLIKIAEFNGTTYDRIYDAIHI